MEFLAGFADNAAIFFLIFVRIFALLQITPLLSSSALPAMARVGLAFMVSFLVFPLLAEAGYEIPGNGLLYVLLLLGEAMVGIILGFFLVLMYSVFQVAGQFFTLQMGFGASQVFDPLAQVEIPIMGQFLNIIAMFIFILVGGFQKVFLVGVYQSFISFKAVDLVLQRESIIEVLLSGLAHLFQQALIISFPILGTLFLVSISMGLLAKAAPQMNLLMLGFPLSIGVAFLLLFTALPFIMEAFSKVINEAFEVMFQMVTPRGVG